MYQSIDKQFYVVIIMNLIGTKSFDTRTYMMEQDVANFFVNRKGKSIFVW